MTKNILAISSAMALLVGASGCNSASAEYGAEYPETTLACGQIAAPILTARASNPLSLQLGTAIISNTPSNVIVDLSANPLLGFAFNEILIYVGTGPAPTDGSGYPDFTQFGYGRSYYPGVTSHTATFALSDYFVDPANQQLVVSVFVKASRTLPDTTVENKEGWAYGPNAIGCACYGVSFNYGTCTEEEETTGCTLTQGYWKTHSQFAKNRSQRIDWPTPMDESQTLCATDSRTLLQILKANPSGGDAYLILAHQYIAAKLNAASGASSTDEVDLALIEAKNLIDAHCGTSVHSSTADGQLMVILAGVLDAYNNGLTGPGHCGQEE